MAKKNQINEKELSKVAGGRPDKTLQQQDENTDNNNDKIFINTDLSKELEIVGIFKKTNQKDKKEEN